MKYLLPFFLLPLIAIQGLKINIIPDTNAKLHYFFCSKEECSNPHASPEGKIWGMIYHFAVEHGGTCAFTDYKHVNVKKRQNIIDADAVILWNIPCFVNIAKFKKVSRDKQFLFLFEPPTVISHQYNPRLTQYFKKIFTWDDDLVDNVHYFKFRYPVLRSPTHRRIPFSEKKLTCMIISNKESNHPKELYSKRRSIIQSLNTSGQFDLYGTGWGKLGYQCYKGAVGDKIEVASHYKFSFCIENMGQVKGYITEKIFDGLAALSVPIYEGATNIAEEIPEGCFIDLRKFSSMGELMHYLTSMDEETYNEYIGNILAFLKSEAAKKYSAEALFENIKKEIFDTLPSN